MFVTRIAEHISDATVTKAENRRKSSYRQIMKSSALIGGAQFVNILLGMVRIKFVAVLLGPAGIGLRGIYLAITGLVGGLSSLGISASGVRDVAQACGSGDPKRLARTVLTLRRMVWLTGLAGALLLTVLAAPISFYTFGASTHAFPLVLLSLTILMTSLAGGQAALIQGTRRIGDLARMTVIGAVIGSVIGIAMYYFYGLNGIVPALIVVAAFNLAVAWWFARKIQIVDVKMTWRKSFSQAGGLVSLGVAMMLSGLITMFVAFLTRALITRQIGLEAVGIFQAGFGLSAMFINFVLKAMGADFYPHLTAVSSDHREMNRLVNEQTEIGLLLAVPGLITTIIIVPWIIPVFYTSEFLPAVDLMRWFVFGCLGRVLSWPMGFILLAKGKSKLFFASETLFGIVHALLIWVGLKFLGLLGVAMAFVLLYVFYTVFMLVLSRWLTGFRWNKGVRMLLMGLLPPSIGVFAGSLLLPVFPATVMGVAVSIAVSLYCIRQLANRLGPDHKVCRIVSRIPLGNRILGVVEG